MTRKIIAAGALLVMTTAAQAQITPPNLFGEIRSHPNASGGQTYEVDPGLTVRPRSNPFGGFPVYDPNNTQIIRCFPNVGGGQTCR